MKPNKNSWNRGLNKALQNKHLGISETRERAEYCFESTVSEERTQKRSGDPNPQSFSKSTAVQIRKWAEYCFESTVKPLSSVFETVLPEPYSARFRETGSAKNGVCNRCPYRRCRVDTEFPYQLFSLILCLGESVEAELSHWFWRHRGSMLNFRIGFLSSTGGRLPYPCLPTPFPILRTLNWTFLEWFLGTKNHDGQRRDRILRFFPRPEIRRSPYTENTENLETKERIPWRKVKKIQWRRRPQNCRFLSLVVVERVLSFSSMFEVSPYFEPCRYDVASKKRNIYADSWEGMRH